DDKFNVHVEDEQHFRRVKKKYDLNNKPILYMGAIENRKNIIGILKIADIVGNKIDNEFLLIGKKGYGFENLYEQIKMRDNVRHIEYVDEEDIQYVYKAASIFLFPSFYEGFGLPPLEAMKSGIPTLASNTSSLKEVIGNGGILFEPTEYEAFANEILKLLNNSEYYREIQQRGIAVAEKYNLENTTKKMVDIFNDFAY
ncbi:MAG TPA: glycosyltransferase family 1 protein, partial [Ignavibacteria bacterium]|nr:glycosyltransferase family 1 protein [Ignavibacteria bacterium]